MGAVSVSVCMLFSELGLSESQRLVLNKIMYRCAAVGSLIFILITDLLEPAATSIDSFS